MIGVVTAAVSRTLGDDGRQYKAGDMIYICESNVNHMKRRHLSAYNKYGDRLSNIISEPDYVGINEDEVIITTFCLYLFCILLNQN